MTKLVQLIPPTTVSCGVKDYAKRLATTWYGEIDALTHVYSVGAQTARVVASLPIFTQNERSPAVILHYSGYGYARRGAPVWLVRFVQRFRKQHANIPWLTMFHEVAASGPVHTSAFWTRPLQLWVAQRLRQLSDRVFTNCTMNADILCEASPKEKGGIGIVPVFSNFGEPTSHVPVNDRHSQLVIFTSNFGGRNPPPEFWQRVAQTVDLHHVERVLLIGRPVSLLLEVPFPVQQTGFLETEQVSELLSQSRFGYAFFGPQLLGKSGIFAAFAAHGVIPLVPVSDVTLPDGLIAGLHFLRPCDDSNALDLETVQSGLLQWYRQHDLTTTAADFMIVADRLRNNSCLH
jgi:hypothetical protein